MEIQELIRYRKEALEECTDEDGFVSEPGFLEWTLPFLNDAKLVDSEDYNPSYHISSADNIKVDGYKINESGERMQLFMVWESTIDVSLGEDTVLVSQKTVYDQQFNRAYKFLTKALRRHLTDELQDSSPAKSLANFLGSREGQDQIDVVEIFLLSPTVTVERRGAEPQPKSLAFDDDKVLVNYVSKTGEKQTKEIAIYKRLIDINFLYSVMISQGNREALTVEFSHFYYRKVEVLSAANEEHFESYLCVLAAPFLYELYRKYSTRILEKNVRSFLQFRGVNKGIKETIKSHPELFIAYNNGLTITAVDAELTEENGKVYLKSLKDFQIVNGGQTTASIYFSKKEGLDISKVKVMAKINVAKDADEEKLNELISNISVYSNAQSKVSAVDLKSRNEHLIRLKSLSESIVTPSGKKWFFERFKGEFNTMIRKNPKGKARINAEYPKDRRFSKEELAKYYLSWGEQPYTVKKGGEKIFRLFLEDLAALTGTNKTVIDRNFFEETIAKVILFRTLEKQHGAGKNALGQLRSAVVPYTLAAIYKYTGQRGHDPFDLAKVWKQEGLDENFKQVTLSLMALINSLIKQYAKSDDLGEYAKKKELWDDISSSKELKQFFESTDFQTAIQSYILSKEELKKRHDVKRKAKEVDFSLLHSNVAIFSKSSRYYKKLRAKLLNDISDAEQRRIDLLITKIEEKQDISESLCEFESELIQKIRQTKPSLLDEVEPDEDTKWTDAYNFLLEKYNTCISEKRDIKSEFSRERELAKLKGRKYYTVLDPIADKLTKGQAPAMMELFHLTECLQRGG